MYINQKIHDHVKRHNGIPLSSLAYDLEEPKDKIESLLPKSGVFNLNGKIYIFQFKDYSDSVL